MSLKTMNVVASRTLSTPRKIRPDSGSPRTPSKSRPHVGSLPLRGIVTSSNIQPRPPTSSPTPNQASHPFIAALVASSVPSTEVTIISLFDEYGRSQPHWLEPLGQRATPQQRPPASPLPRRPASAPGHLHPAASGNGTAYSRSTGPRDLLSRRPSLSGLSPSSPGSSQRPSLTCGSSMGDDSSFGSQSRSSRRSPAAGRADQLNDNSSGRPPQPCESGDCVGAQWCDIRGSGSRETSFRSSRRGSTNGAGTGRQSVGWPSRGSSFCRKSVRWRAACHAMSTVTYLRELVSSGKLDRDDLLATMRHKAVEWVGAATRIQAAERGRRVRCRGGTLTMSMATQIWRWRPQLTQPSRWQSVSVRFGTAAGALPATADLTNFAALARNRQISEQRAC